MNIIEAVPRMRDGEIMVTNEAHIVNVVVRIDGGSLQYNSERNPADLGWQPVSDKSLWLFSSDFIPYEPKSVIIEEAIEDIARAFNETTTTMHPAQYGMVSKVLTRLANSMKVKV